MDCNPCKKKTCRFTNNFFFIVFIGVFVFLFGIILGWFLGWLLSSTTTQQEMEVAYGGLYSDTSQIIALPGGGDYVGVEFGDFMTSENIELSINTITIETSGVYRVDYNLIVAPNLSEPGILIGVFVNGVPILSTLQGHVLSTNAQTNISGFDILTLEDGDILTLEVSSISASTLQLGPAVNAAFSAIKLNDD